MSSQARLRREKFFSVFVGNLHLETTKEDVFNLFSKCGVVCDFVVMPPKEGATGSYGFVRYEKPEEAMQAIKDLNGWQLKSNKLIVDLGHETAERLKTGKPVAPPVVDIDLETTLPAEDLVDRVKRQAFVKEAILNISSQSSHYDIIKLSRLTTELERYKYAMLLPPRPSKRLHQKPDLSREIELLSSDSENHKSVQDLILKVLEENDDDELTELQEDSSLGSECSKSASDGVKEAEETQPVSCGPSACNGLSPSDIVRQSPRAAAHTEPMNISSLLQEFRKFSPKSDCDVKGNVKSVKSGVTKYYPNDIRAKYLTDDSDSKQETKKFQEKDGMTAAWLRQKRNEDILQEESWSESTGSDTSAALLFCKVLESSSDADSGKLSD